MKVYIAADHAGMELKAALMAHLSEHEVIDMGAFDTIPGDDYPDVVAPCAERVAGDTASIGIVIGGSGHGEAMVANRQPGVRAATFYGPRAALSPLEAQGTASTDEYDIVRIARMHNDANVLSLGTRFISVEEATRAVDVFIETMFSGDAHHARRIEKF